MGAAVFVVVVVVADAVFDVCVCCRDVFCDDYCYCCRLGQWMAWSVVVVTVVGLFQMEMSSSSSAISLVS